MSRSDEVFGSIGVTVRTFVESAASKRVGLIAEVPDMEALQAVLTSEAGAEAMKHDGVHPDTLVVLVES